MMPARNYTEGALAQVAEDIVAIYGVDGADFIRVCPPHAWASQQSVYRSTLPTCPHCELSKDSDGRRRYDEVQLRLMPEGARP